MCRCLSRHWSLAFVLWTLLSFVLINGCVPALILKHSRSFYLFRGCVCTDFRVYSGVGVVGVQLTKYSLDVMPGSFVESLATDRKTVWDMHAPDVNACPWHRRCFCQIELVKRSCWSFPPPEIASLPPVSSCPKTVFPRFLLVAEPLIYPASPAHIPVLYSRVLQTNFGRSHPKNSNWEGNIHCAHVQA